MRLPSIKSMTMFLLVSLLVFLPLMPACGGSGDEGSKTQSVLGALTNTYDDPLILEYYQRANQAYINAGYDLTRLSLEIGKCVGTTAAIPILGIIGCTNTFYDVYETSVRTGKDWAEISVLYDNIKNSQEAHGFSVFHLDPNTYPQVPEQYRTFYSWNDFRELNAATVLEPIVGSGTQIADLAASPYGEFARLSLQYYEGKMQTVIVNVNPMFLSIPQATKTQTAASPSSGSSGLAKSPWPMLGHDPQHTGRSLYSGPLTPELKWSYNTGYHVGCWFSAVGASGTIYVGGDNLQAINPDGSLKWSYETENRAEGNPAIGPDETIYVSDYQDRLFAINPDGSLKWSYETDLTGMAGSPTVAEDGTIYFQCRGDLYAMNPNGSLKWICTDVGSMSGWMAPAIGPDGTIYVGGGNDLRAINEKGSLLWSYRTKQSPYSGGQISTPAIGADGTIYVGTYGSDLDAINPDGSLRWSYSGLEVMGGLAIGKDGTIYVTGFGGVVCAINPNGTLTWKYSAEGDILCEPIIGYDGILYVGQRPGKVLAINPDGSLRWSYPLGMGPFFCTSLVGNTLYAGSGDGTLYAIGE